MACPDPFAFAVDNARYPPRRIRRMKTTALFLGFLSAVLLGAAHAVIVQTVTVGDLGNPNDTTDYGGVSSTYAIGTYEVTLLQYTAFLNAVGATDTNALYNPSMGGDLNIAGISRSGASGSFAYSVIGDGDRPVTYVSWFDAARFTNWMHNGQPTGLQTASTTENGAYALLGANSGVEFSKSLGAQYWVPDESEWYKAAYYQPLAAGGDTDGYWLYPTASNAIPNSRNGSITDANSGNFIRDDGIANGFNGGYAVTNSTTLSDSQNYLTPVGAFTQADSYYGTFDQGGNVAEWNDAVISGSSRGVRGGSWGFDESGLQASFRNSGLDPDFEFLRLGFRVATVPEPSVTVSLIFAGELLLSRRKRPS